MASIIKDVRYRRQSREIEHKKKLVEQSNLAPDAKEQALKRLERQKEELTEKYVDGTL